MGIVLEVVIWSHFVAKCVLCMWQQKLLFILIIKVFFAPLARTEELVLSVYFFTDYSLALINAVKIYCVLFLYISQ